MSVSVRDVAFTSDNSKLVVAYDYAIDKNNVGIQVIDLSTGEQISDQVLLERGDNYQTATVMNLSPDGTALALTNEPDSFAIGLWNLSSGQLQEEIPGSDYFPLSLAFSKDSQMIAVGIIEGFGTKMTLWDVLKGSSIQSFDLLKGHNAVTDTKAIFYPSESKLITATLYDYILDDSLTVSVIDLASGDELLTFEAPIVPDMAGGIFNLGISNNGQMLAIGSAAAITIYDTSNGEELLSIDYPVDNNRYFGYRLLFSPDDSKLLSGSESAYQVILWDVTTGERVAP